MSYENQQQVSRLGRSPDPFVEVSPGVGVQMSATLTIAKPSIRKMHDGLMMTRSDASVRYLTFGETLRFRLFNSLPADIVPVEVENE